MARGSGGLCLLGCCYCSLSRLREGQGFLPARSLDRNQQVPLPSPADPALRRFLHPASARVRVPPRDARAQVGWELAPRPQPWTRGVGSYPKPSEQGSNTPRALSRARAEVQSSIHSIQSLHLLTNSREHGTSRPFQSSRWGRGGAGTELIFPLGMRVSSQEPRAFSRGRAWFRESQPSPGELALGAPASRRVRLNSSSL